MWPESMCPSVRSWLWAPPQTVEILTEGTTLASFLGLLCIGQGKASLPRQELRKKASY